MRSWIGCFTKARNNRQISTGDIYFLTRGGTPLQSIFFLAWVLLGGSFSAEEQPQIFRLRFTALKMTVAFLFLEQIVCTFGWVFHKSA